MKIIKKSILIFAAVFALNSCDDVQEIIQPGELLDKDIIQDIDDLNRVVIGLHSLIPAQGEIQFVSTFTDELSIGDGNGGQGITNDALYAFNLNPTTGLSSGIWTSHYSLIADINFFIDQTVDKLGGTLSDPEDVDNFNYALGVMHTLRAYSYAKLVSYYSENPEDPNALAVPLVDFAIEEFDENNVIALNRSTVQDLTTFIRQDFVLAENFFNLVTDITGRATANRTFVDNNFLEATKARFFNTIGEFTEASTAANNVLASISPAPFTNDFYDVWDDTGVAGVIFKKEQTQNDAEIGSYFNTRRASSSGVQIFEWGRSIYNEYDTDDIRLLSIGGRQSWLDATSSVDPNYVTASDPLNSDILIINKYSGSGGFDNVNDIKLFRSAEMLFITIEAALRQAAPDLTTASNNMNLFRTFREGTPPVVNYTTVAEGLEDLLLERRKELWLEGHRYLDMKRIGRLINASFEKDPVDCQIANVVANCTLSANDDKLTLPIPQAELAANPSITQNTGY